MKSFGLENLALKAVDSEILSVLPSLIMQFKRFIGDFIFYRVHGHIKSRFKESYVIKTP